MRPGVVNRQPGGRADRYRIDDPHPLLGTLYLHDNHPLEPTLRPTPYRRSQAEYAATPVATLRSARAVPSD